MTTTQPRPPLVKVRGLYYPTDITPEEVFQRIGKLRKEAQDEIERLLTFLDETGPDCDEDTGVDDGPVDDDELEPSLGFSELMNQDKHRNVYGHGATEDFEYDEAEQREISDLEHYGEADSHDGFEPEEDFEPSLVSAEGNAAFSPNQWPDGEVGGLSVAELDRLRETRSGRSNESMAHVPEGLRSDGRLVRLVRNRNRVCNVRPLSPAEQARYVAQIVAH